MSAAPKLSIAAHATEGAPPAQCGSVATHAIPATTPPPGDANDAVRAALRMLPLQRRAGDPRGVSVEDMAIACGVSHQYMSKVLSGAVALTPNYLARLPQRAYDVAMAALERCRRAPAPIASDDDKAGLLAELLGERASRLRRAKADGVIDAQERAELDHIDGLIAALALRQVQRG